MRLQSLFSKCALAVATLLLSGTLFHAQAQPGCAQAPLCLSNGELTTNGATTGDMNSSAPGVGPTTVNSWYVSHGSPSIWSPAPGGAPNAIWMWSYDGRGEGIYSCYRFQAGHQYRICLWVQNTGQSPINPGNLMIFAANGLNGNGPAGTGVPAPGSSQLISSAHTVNMSWIQLTYWFTPNANYNELWIYPFRAGPSVNFGQYELIVDRINVFEVPLGIGMAIPCGGTITLNAPTGCPGVSYDWYDPSMNYIGSGTVIIPNADPSMDGNYTLMITSGDCTAQSGIQIMVEPCEPCDKFQPNFDMQGQCNPRTFIDMSSGPGTSVAWFWEFGDGGTSNLQNPTHAYATGGVYEVCLTVIRKSGRETCCKRICRKIDVCDPHGDPVEPGDPVGFKFDYLNATQQAVKFQDVIKGDKVICQYQWDFGDGNTSNLPNPAHVYEQPGLYNVCLNVQYCDYNETNKISQSRNYNYCQTVRAKGSLTVSEIDVIPNPATDKATIMIRNIKEPVVSLRNVHGAEVAKAQSSGEGKYTFNLDNLSAGIYMVTVEGKEGKFVKKLVKK